jgi:hypothetical protein
MNPKNRILTGTAILLALSSIAVGAGVAQSQLTTQSKIFVDGFGRAKVGMTVNAASSAAATRLVSLDGKKILSKGCSYVKPKTEPQGIQFMLTDGRIARVDVVNNKQITTVSGAKIGDTEAKIKSLYPGKIKVTPHKYVTGGHYLTFTSDSPNYKNYRVVFETDGNRVTRYRAGKLPEVEFVEGCS